MSTHDPAARLLDLPGVRAEIDAARQACEKLRWHPAMRRRSAQVRAEAGFWQAWASAALDGARLAVEEVRLAGVGALPLPDDGVGRVVSGALRAVSEADRLAEHGGRLIADSPAQALARLHLAAAGTLIEPDQIGRPSVEAAPRLRSVVELLRHSKAPAAVVAAVAHAEIVDSAMFAAAPGVVARALARAIVVGRGLDPMGAAVPDVYWRDNPDQYQQALAAYASGSTEGVTYWLVHDARAMTAGAQFGQRLGDAVISGTPLTT